MNIEKGARFWYVRLGNRLSYKDELTPEIHDGVITGGGTKMISGTCKDLSYRQDGQFTMNRYMFEKIMGAAASPAEAIDHAHARLAKMRADAERLASDASAAIGLLLELETR